MGRCRATILAVAVAWASSEVLLAQPDAFQVVVNASNHVEQLPKTNLAKLFLKKEVRWPSGLTAIPVDQNAESPTRESFSRAIHGRGAEQIRKYWLRVIFAGLDEPPLELDSDDEVLEFIRHNAGAVGYVAAGIPLSDRVKTLEIVE